MRRFEWAVRHSQPQELRALLLRAGLDARPVEAPPAETDDAAEIVLALLRSVGSNFDEREQPEVLAPIIAMFAGEADGDVLASAIDLVAQQHLTGLLVDTRYPTVEVDEHVHIGKGTVVLVAPGGSKWLIGGSIRTLHQVLRGERDDPRDGSPIGGTDGGTLHSQDVGRDLDADPPPP